VFYDERHFTPLRLLDDMTDLNIRTGGGLLPAVRNGRYHARNDPDFDNIDSVLHVRVDARQTNDDVAATVEVILGLITSAATGCDGPALPKATR
jgi:hypothetical protein